MKWLRIFGVIFLCNLQFFSAGQLSIGGYPRKIVLLKSAVQSTIILPEVDNQKLLLSSMNDYGQSTILKPFRFAHPFEVNLDPLNCGTWGRSDDGYQVWRLEIRSKGAYSLNLKFESFKLSALARLYVFSAGMEEVRGAFSDLNNEQSGIFSISPVQGDDIFVQYEIPPDAPKNKDFVITRVNHDFVNILKRGDRRPLGTVASSCNLDINCGSVAFWNRVKDAVCRIIIDGVEICTGTLLNNTSEDQIPYIITANHCISDHPKNFGSVFLFNYESPYCGSLDGDVTNSLSGCMLKANFDSLDFALLQLNVVPPPAFRPFFAGWNRTGIAPDSVATIHHPEGDIKKIAIDRNSPSIASYNSEYVKNGFLKTARWEIGTTEKGSSGAPYINPQMQLIGTLTGGAAVCGNSVNDYFMRLDKAWDYRPEPEKQLKNWLDPGNRGYKSIWGRNFNSGIDYCNAFTNLRDGDRHQLVRLIDSSQKNSGYWSGTNGDGITEVAEKFFIKGNEAIQGVSFGAGIIKLKQGASESKITIRVYEGTSYPKTEIYSQQVRLRDLAQDAMNYVKFSQVVTPIDTFFVGFELSNVQAGDTFAVYQTVRNSYPVNSFLFKKGSSWLNFNNPLNGNKPAALVLEILACNVDTATNEIPLVKDTMEILLYPNPFGKIINFEAGDYFEPENIHVYDLVGHPVQVRVTRTARLKARLDFSGNLPGIYFIRLYDQKRNITKKVVYFPQ